MLGETWDRGTRWLHAGLAATVTIQLFVSLIMETPQPGLKPQPFGLLGFRIHQTAGVAVVAVVLAHWAWSAAREGGRGLRHLFPWTGPERAAVVADLRRLKAGEVPEGGPVGGLAGLVHGLGFLAVTGMAALGAALLLLPEAGPGASLQRAAADLHEGLANLVWLYWLGHLAMVFVHERRGHRLLAGIFRP